MKRYRQHILYISLCLGLLIAPFCCSNIGAKDFVVVIDAGHGGHDPGAIGRISKEKNINLNVALKLGKQIQKNCPDVKVVYTRTRDVFIPLNRRAEIANDAKADLFISIHTNALANNRTAKGASTWTLGLAKSDANLEVAKRENSVILYESDYKTRYAGFNPNSAESYIIFEFMQDKYMSQSVHLASLVQKHFRNTCRRVDRGVHQAGFLVLKASAMPSILVELGFISTPEEERYLNTDAGTGTLADGIFRAFLTYKREQEIRLNGSSQTILPEDLPQPEEKTPAPADTTPETEKKATARNNKPAPQPSEKATVAQTEDKAPVFKIQILTSSRPLAKNDKRLKGLKDVDYYKEGGLYKYTYGASSDYNKVLRTKRSITAKFKDAFIIAFKNGRKVNVNTAIREFKNKRNKYIMKYITKEVRIGIAGIAALCILVYGINYLKGIHMFKPSSYFYVKFHNVNGLTKSSPVFADGFRVGIVRDLYYDYTQPGKVVAEIDVNTDLRIPKGSTAELATEMLGGVKMNLLLANNPREKYQVGDTIPGTLNNGMMEKVATMMPQLEKMLPKLDSILGSLNTVLADPAIPATLHNVQNLTANLTVTSGQLQTLMNKDIPQLTGKLNTIGDNFVLISNNLKEIDYATAMQSIDSTLANVKMLTDKLNRKDNTVGLLLNDPSLYNNLNATTANAASLLEDLKSHPKRYVHFSLFGKKDK